MRTGFRRAGRTGRAAIAVLIGIGLLTVDVGSAAPVDKTVDIGNSVTARTVPPPTNVRASLSLVLFQVGCRSTITWTGPPGITAFDVRRRVASTGAVDAGPWRVNVTATPPYSYSFTDQVPLQLLSNPYDWQVRSVSLPDMWTSTWVTSAPTGGLPVLCFLNLGGRAASGEAASGTVDEQSAVVPDEPAVVVPVATDE